MSDAASSPASVPTAPAPPGETSDESGAYPLLFTPYRMAGLTVRNRIVMAGHGTRFTDPHSMHLADRQIEYFAERARGGVGIIVQGSAMVHPTGFALPGMVEAWTDSSIPAYARLADAVHEHGAAVFAQLSHLGRQGSSFVTQRELWAPSAIPDPASRSVPHAMTKADIAELLESYRAAAARFLRAGFDGIEVYMCHGFLLCEFLSAASNHRTDEYGGSLENRARLPLQVIETVREVVGPEVPVGIRISAEEFVPGGLTVDEMASVVDHLTRSTQLEYVSVSQGNYVSAETLVPDMSFRRMPFVHFAATVRRSANGVPVMAVARIVTPENSEELLRTQTADFICLVRPLIADPYFPEKARTGRREDIRECISCNVGCRGGPHRGMPVMCLVNPAVGFEATQGETRIRPADPVRSVLVVGGGPAGLKAAETAARRGHRVTLLEASDALGGQVPLAASAMPYRDEFANSTRFLERQLHRLGVEVRTGVTATADLVAEAGADFVVVATGSRPGRPDIPGSETGYTVHEALRGGVPGKNVVLVDSGEADWKCLTTAERLAADGHEVRIVTPVAIGAELDVFSRPPLIRRLRKAGVTFVEGRTLVAVEGRQVHLRENWTGDPEVLDDVDAVVFSWFGVANDSLLHELHERGIDAQAVGDCLAPRRAIDAIWDGFRVGLAI